MYFANGVLTVLRLSATLTGEDYTFINYPLNFLSPGGISKLSGSFHFQHFKRCTMDLKQAKGPAKQWCSIKHHGVNITTPPPLSLMDWMVVYSPGQERYLKQAKGPAQQVLILIGEM